MTADSSSPTAVVIGGGIVGACAAHALQTHGFATTLIDRGQPGQACSFGNAGRIATSLTAPKSVPGLVWKIPGMLSDPGHPLKTSIGTLLREVPWFTRFFLAGRPGRVAEITGHMNTILSRTDAAFDRLIAATDAGEIIRRAGTLYVYKDPRLADAVRDSMEASRALGVDVRYLYGNEAREVDPALPTSITCAYHKPLERHVRSPYELTRAVVTAFARAGGLVVRDEVVDLEHGRSGTTVRTRGQRFRPDRTVVAAGAWSRHLARRLRVNLPVIAERGYHAMLPAANVGLKTAIHFADALVAMTQMSGGLRVSSGAEFLDVDAPARWSRRDIVIEGARKLYPDLDTEGATRWMGSRPSTPDSMPVIGAHPKAPDVLFATGHGTIGLTLAPITAEIITALATDTSLDFDPAPYSPTRF